MDSESHNLWEAELSQRDSEIETVESSTDADLAGSLPKFADFIRFLERRMQALHMLASERKGVKRPAPASSIAGNKARKVFHFSFSRSLKSDIGKCPLCSVSHSFIRYFMFQDKVS